MNRQQQLIWDYLINNALGKANEKHVSDIAKAIGAKPYGTNNDDIRRLMTSMVRKHGKQIGSTRTGVFVILTDAEREEAAQYAERNSKAPSIRSNGNYIP